MHLPFALTGQDRFSSASHSSVFFSRNTHFTTFLAYLSRSSFHADVSATYLPPIRRRTCRGQFRPMVSPPPPSGARGSHSSCYGAAARRRPVSLLCSFGPLLPGGDRAELPGQSTEQGRCSSIASVAPAPVLAPPFPTAVPAPTLATVPTSLAADVTVWGRWRSLRKRTEAEAEAEAERRRNRSRGWDGRQFGLDFLWKVLCSL